MDLFSPPESGRDPDLRGGFRVVPEGPMILSARDQSGGNPVVAKIPEGLMILSARDKSGTDLAVAKVVPEGPMILAGRFSARDKGGADPVVAKRRFIPETVRAGFTACVAVMRRADELNRRFATRRLCFLFGH